MTSSLPPSARKDFERAVSLFQNGRLAIAESICGELLARFPDDAELAHFCGVLATRSGRLDVAIQRLVRSVGIQPTAARAHAALGFAQEQSGRLEEARRSFEAAVSLDPAFAEAHTGLAVVHQRGGRLAEASRAFERAVALSGSVDARLNSARALLQLGRMEAAALRLREALESCGDRPDALRLIAAGLLHAGEHAAAVAAFERYLASQPRDSAMRAKYALALVELDRLAEARTQIDLALPATSDASVQSAHGLVLMNEKNVADAVEAFERALELEPGNAETRVNLAMALRALGRRGEMLPHMQAATSNGALDAGGLARLASLYGEEGDSATAMALASSALQSSPSHPDAHRIMASELLGDGQFEKGWRHYAFRTARGAVLPRLPANLANADIALIQEQGIGDVLFFLRYARPLAEAGARLHVSADRRLEPLVRRALAVASWFDGPVAPEGWTAFAMGDLPLAVGNLVREPAPSLRIAPLAERENALRSRLQLGGSPCIAIAWRAGTPPPPGPRKRSALSKEIDPATFGAALRGIGARFVSIQRNPAAGETDEVARAMGAPLTDLASVNEDLEDMLALLALVDDYVGVSSTNVHLRAAAGCGGRILVPNPAEWRWQKKGESPWFPGFVTYRQQVDGDWSVALERLSGDLRARGNG